MLGVCICVSVEVWVGMCIIYYLHRVEAGLIAPIDCFYFPRKLLICYKCSESGICYVNSDAIWLLISKKNVLKFSSMHVKLGKGS